MRFFQFLAGCLLLTLGACAGGENTGLLIPLGDDVPAGRRFTILSATSRGEAEPDQPRTMFGATRADGNSYALFHMSAPTERKIGELTTDATRPDPQKHFVLLSSQRLGQPEFIQKLRQEMQARPPADRRILVFTHGFNTRFDDAVFRFSQIVDDTGFTGVPVLFSWPSRGSATAYGYDRDSATFSRDKFEALLTLVGNEKSVASVEIFAHSMGNWLTLETLRQASIANNKSATGKLVRVILAAPDVDMDVFRTQIRRMGPLSSKFVLYASSDDKALRLSQFLFGGQGRAGENTNIEDFKRLGIQAHDLSGVPGALGKNHGKAFNDAETIQGIGTILNDSQPEPHHGNVLSQSVDALTGVVRRLQPGHGGAAPVSR